LRKGLPCPEGYGNATISFYNADNRATIKVDAEGIAEQRVPLVGKTSFEVK
jgi:hypothetical protein